MTERAKRCSAVNWYGERCLEPEGHQTAVDGSRRVWHTTGFCVWVDDD